MRRILNEMARMKKIAGIISEGHYEEGADVAKSEEITMEGDEVNEARGNSVAKIKAIISKLKPKDSGGMQFADYGDELVDVNDIYVFRRGVGIPGYRGVAVGQGIDDQGAAGATLYWLLTGDMESDDPNGYPSGVLEPGEGESDLGDDEPVRPRDPNAPDFYEDPEGALKYYKSKYKY